MRMQKRATATNPQSVTVKDERPVKTLLAVMIAQKTEEVKRCPTHPQMPLQCPICYRQEREAGLATPPWVC